MGKGFESGGAGGGAAGTAAELAVGFGLAQQMMQQGFTGGTAAPSVAAAPDVLAPADAAKVLGVGEADVLAVLDKGELKGKKIGSQWRITRAAPPQVALAGDVWARNTPVRPAVRRPNGTPASRSSCARSAVRSRRMSSIARPARSRRSISSRRFASCRTRSAGGRRLPAASSARAAAR
jgi:excisionase family DNA binding protein